MRFDKETLSRQRFWFCLGGFVLIWGIALLTAKVSASGKITEGSKKYKAADDGLAKFTEPKTPHFWAPWNDTAKEYHGHIQVVWKDAWDLQKDLLTWPSNERFQLNQLWKDAQSWADWRQKFEDESRNTGTAARGAYKESLYKQQFKGLDQRVAPVAFRDGEVGFKSIMLPALGGGRGANPRTGPDRATGNQPAAGLTVDTLFQQTPSTEECCYAQEDFWVKREILEAVKRTLDSVGSFSRERPGFWTGVAQLAEHPDRVFSPDAPTAKKPERGEAFVKENRFRNSSWELHLFFEQDNGKFYVSKFSTIKNVHASRRVQMVSRLTANGKREPLEFRLRQRHKGDKVPRDFILRVEAGALASENSAEFDFKKPEPGKELEDPSLLNNIDPREPFEVEQVFDWYTAPIRRIEDIRTCYNSHRTANVPLKPHPTFVVKAETGGAAAGQPGQPGQPTPPPAGQPPAGPPTGDAAAAAQSQATEYNGLEKNRYLNVTDTCHDMPFAVVVILEQPYLGDFLVQLANSPLRIQITQHSLVRVHKITPPQAQAPGDPAKKGGDVPFGQPAQPAQPTQLEVTDSNLVEVTVYGIAALYEKYYVKPEGQ